MKKIFEDFVESSDYVISVFFKELESQVQKWFTEGSLGASGCKLVQISNSEIMNPMQKTQIVEFLSPENYFQLIFMVRLDELSEDGNQIEKVHMKIKRYSDNESNHLERELLDEVDVEDIKEDFIIDKISEIDKEEDDDKEPDLGDTKNQSFE
jgi:hypothetical protein